MIEQGGGKGSIRNDGKRSILNRPAARGLWSRHRPDTALGWVCIAAAGASWIYACAVGLVFLHMPGPSAQWDWLAQWIAVPVQFLAMVLVALVLSSSSIRPGPERSAWWCILVFTAGSSLATYVWNVVRPEVQTEVLSFEDGIYLADYWALTATFAFLFVRAGGSFRLPRVWLDATTMTAVQLVGLWSFFLGPSVTNGTGGGISVAATLAYSVTLTCMMTMAALLCLQLPSFRGRAAVLLLVGAGAAEVAWEIMWLVSWLTNSEFVGSFYNFGDVLCFAAVVSSVAATQFRAPLPSDTANPERRADSFLPALAALLAIGLVAGSVATTRRWDAWILVGLVALCTLLLITRQKSVRKELRELNRQLAKREADARITELVRRSTDLIMVVGADGTVNFASPATEPMLGMPAALVQNMRAVDLFGPDYSGVLTDFLERVRAQPAAPSVIELRMPRAGDNFCVIKLSAANQLTNQLINGIVLTLTDITEQRMLEREVLDVAARERVRLSADIHDGLGQELVGISMLLHGAAAAPDPDPAVQKSQLQIIVGHVNRTVSTARDLARGLSPLHVVRGSLHGALLRLVPESNTSVQVRLDVDSAFEERVIDDFYADHLYRIAQEAVNNALRHSGCTHIDVALRRGHLAIELVIEDNGRGFEEPSPDYPGLGLRLMAYRARIVGGTLRVDKAQGSGTRVEFMMPLNGVHSTETKTLGRLR